MKSKKQIKKKNNKSPEFSVFEFNINKKYFPKNKGNLARDYNRKQSNILKQLHDLELDLIFSQLRIKNIVSVIFGKKRKNRPINVFYIHELNKEISRFITGYENYCLRVFIYREIITSFIATFLKIEADNYWDLMKDSKAISLKISNLLKKFDTGILKEVIGYRHKLTHKIEFNDEGFKKYEIKIDELMKDHGKKNQNIKKSLNEILKIKKGVERQILSQYDN